jgi:ATPase family associated with various cellular activities (AAA)
MNAVATMPASTFSTDLCIEDALTASWLAEATLLLRREICWLWHQRGTSSKQHSDQLPPAIDGISESLDLQRFSEDKKDFFASDVTARYLSERIHHVRAHRKISHGPWASIQKRLDLDDATQFVLALAVLARIDPASAAIFAACHNDSQKTFPTLALANRLYDSADDMLHIDTAHALFRFGMLSFSGANDTSGWHQAYEVSSLIAHVLMRDDGRMPSELRLVSPQESVAKTNPVLEAAIHTLLEPPANTEFIPLLGDAGSDFREWLSLLSHKTGRLMVEVVHATLPSQNRLASLAAWCWLYDADFVLPMLTSPSAEHSHERMRWPDIPVRWYAPMHDVQAIKTLPEHALKPSITLPNTDFEMRVARLHHVLGHRAENLENEILESARRFRLSAKAIQAVGRAAAQSQYLDGDGLQALCRSQVRLDLGSLAQAVTPRFQLNELVLPPAQALQLNEIVHAMQSLTRVHYQWGMARAWNDAGLSVLFCGPPGTGKTMAAEAIAHELQLPMFRIDLSQVVNKYIGETEKNLKRVFDAAEESDCVIFFDEADALFGKRTSVKDAHDRFANIEISYLLERMERLKGIAILATNRRKDLDEAFLRRLRYLVEFPLPGVEERERLWRYVFPPNVSIGALDLDYLARTFALAGGHIRSIAFNACLQTKHNADTCVDMLQVLASVKRELDKLNRPNSPESFGKYRETVAVLFEESAR